MIKVVTSKIFRFFENSEPFIFYLFILFHLIPVLFYRYFPTVDGPAHLYNSRLILEMVSNPQSPVHDFLIFNPHINPNWTGHILLVLFLTLLPAFLAEKLLLLIYLIGFPMGFRMLFQTLGVKRSFLVYMVFPFTYSFLFLYGFYNFHFGLVLLFFSISLWIKYLNRPSFKQVLLLFVFSGLMVLSHIFVFAVFLLVIFLLNFNNLKKLLHSSSDKRVLLKSLGKQLLALSAGIVILIVYACRGTNHFAQGIKLPLNTLLKWIIQVQPAKAMVYAKEDIFTKWILYLILLVILTSIIYFLVGQFRKIKIALHQKPGNLLWLILSFVFLILYFILPDTVTGASAGFVSSRLLLFFFLFLFVGLAGLLVPFWLQVSGFLIVSYISFSLLLIYFRQAKENSRIVQEIKKASEYIEPYSTILPINNSDYWLFGHVSNYLGSEIPVIILENYEAELDYFPLKWNTENLPNLHFGSLNTPLTCLRWPSNIKAISKPIDHIFMLNDKNIHQPSAFTFEYKVDLQPDYILEYASEDQRVILYKYKKI
ncbi:MAG: hypothetical protein JXJ22_08605 [Bacteroidales bacterium]|nr:hypothetical protein [Bacteroidales bacterium]